MGEVSRPGPPSACGGRPPIAIAPDDIVPVRVERYGALPAFGPVYSDAKMASVVNYVTARFGAKGSRLFAGDLLAMRDH